MSKSMPVPRGVYGTTQVWYVLRLAVKKAEESHEDNLNRAFQRPY